MKKLAVLFSVFILSMASNAYAKEVATIPSFDVHFNGNKVESEFREYPLLVYKDITYFPMTYFDSRHLGLTTEWDESTRTLSINKESISASLRDYKAERKNSKSQYVTICDFNIKIHGNLIDNSKEEYPFITFRDVTYFPLTWRYAYELFSWHYEFSPEKGLSIEGGGRSQNVRLPYLDGVFSCDEDYYYYVGYKDGKQSIYRADINNTENYTTIYDFPYNYSSSTGKCITSIISDMGNIYFRYHVGSNLMGSLLYVKINPDGTAVEEAPKNYTHSVRADTTYYKETADMSLVVKHDYFDAPSRFYYTIAGVEHEAQMHPDKPHVRAYQEGKNASDSVSSDSLIQILGNNIYFVGKNLQSDTDSALYRINTETGATEKLLENVGAFHAYFGNSEDYYEGWNWRESADENQIGDNIIFDRGGVLHSYNVKTGVVTQMGGTKNGKFIAGLGSRHYIAQQNLETKEEFITQFGVPYSGNIYNPIRVSTKGGAKMYTFGNNLVYRALSEMPEDEIRLAVFKNTVGGFYSSDVAKSVYVNDNTILYSLSGNDETIVKVDFN
ncbi:MAG: hypothetical protein IJD91_02305 [Clostridia bacterium]|nr:hypothetical protein [Clostridia bacterium]